MTVIPISELGQRMPEAGRIRLGVKGDRGPRSLGTLRFTSENEAAIREIAALYEGEAKAWNPKGSRSEWEVVTKAKSVPVILPPDPLRGTPIYELWSGGGLVRRCDGRGCTVARRTPDGAEQAEIPCVCDKQARLECSVKTRLSVILPEIHFAGTWRLETASEYAARELPGMVSTILALQSHGFARAVLAVERRSQVKEGQTKVFVVPVLRSDHTVNEIVEGAASLGALASPEAARPLALPPPPVLDDQIAEAEIVEDDEPELTPPPGVDAETGEILPNTAPLHLIIKLRDAGFDDEARHAICFNVSGGRTTSSKDLTPEEVKRVLRMLERLDRGEVVYAGIQEDGRAIFRSATTQGG